MRCSELIEKLQEMIEIHGDLEVKTYEKLTSEEPGVYYQGGGCRWDDEIQVFT